MPLEEVRVCRLTVVWCVPDGAGWGVPGTGRLVYAGWGRLGVCRVRAGWSVPGRGAGWVCRVGVDWVCRVDGRKRYDG